MSYDRRDPAKAYEQADKDAQRLLKDIDFLLAKMADKFQSKPRDWGYPGSLQHVVGKLAEIKDFLSGNAK